MIGLIFYDVSGSEIAKVGLTEGKTESGKKVKCFNQEIPEGFVIYGFKGKNFRPSDPYISEFHLLSYKTEKVETDEKVAAEDKEETGDVSPTANEAQTENVTQTKDETSTVDDTQT